MLRVEGLTAYCKELRLASTYWGFPKLGAPFFGGPYNKDYNMLVSILGSPYLGKLPYQHSAPGAATPPAATQKTGVHVLNSWVLGILVLAVGGLESQGSRQQASHELTSFNLGVGRRSLMSAGDVDSSTRRPVILTCACIHGVWHDIRLQGNCFIPLQPDNTSTSVRNPKP